MHLADALEYLPVVSFEESAQVTGVGKSPETDNPEKSTIALEDTGLARALDGFILRCFGSVPKPFIIGLIRLNSFN